jgi:hypothetical protein
MARRLTKWQTLATNSSTAVATTAIGDTTITIMGSLQTHYIKINGTADSTSIVIPQGAVVDFEIPVGATISALTHSGQGHITVLYY